MTRRIGLVLSFGMVAVCIYAITYPRAPPKPAKDVPAPKFEQAREKSSSKEENRELISS
jgi:hypothetical protein